MHTHMTYTEVNCNKIYNEFTLNLTVWNILIMYPWVLLTVVQLTKKQQPTFEILLSQIEFF